MNKEPLMASEIDYFAALEPANTIAQAVTAFLTAAGRPGTLAHIRTVAGQARMLAGKFCRPNMAQAMKDAAAAAYCHDMAAVVPLPEIIAVADAWGVHLTQADRVIPQVVHGPLAAEVARQKLGIDDPDILNAIRFHTTLRAGASTLEKVVFLADKLAVDPTAPRNDFLPALNEAMADGLDAGVRVYLAWVIEHGPGLGWKLHPDLLAAFEELGVPKLARKKKAPAASPPRVSRRKKEANAGKWRTADGEPLIEDGDR
jgi:predicted HD superfamily hydrolase involved in NAD metabolism